MTSWLAAVSADFPVAGCKAIIAPHAGYAYSGPTAAWAYKTIDTTRIKRVFILGPSHHVYIDGCALSQCREYETPLGVLPVDTEIVKELGATGTFSYMRLAEDEAEHSIEMHLPYVRKIFEGLDISIVPILVGSIHHDKEISFGASLAPYLAREDTLFVISSDFCHWGTRFSYTFYYPDPQSSTTNIRLSRSVPPSPSHAIYESITKLDHEAMDILCQPPCSAAHERFKDYLSRTRNTICGRHPIGVLMGALATLEKERNVEIKWVRYAQSSECVTVKDSSVSYASAWIKF